LDIIKKKTSHQLLFYLTPKISSNACLKDSLGIAPIAIWGWPDSGTNNNEGIL
jgi:hypothetical protein